MSPTGPNPYAAPASPQAGTATVHSPGGEESAHQVFVAWERLRIFYNLVLFLLALTLSPVVQDLWDTLPWMVVAAIGANVCFCVGPVLEGYIAWCGGNRRSSRLMLFILGMLFASLLAMLTLNPLVMMFK